MKGFWWDYNWRRRLHRIWTGSRLIYTRNLTLIGKFKDEFMDRGEVQLVHQMQWLEILEGAHNGEA